MIAVLYLLALAGSLLWLPWTVKASAPSFLQHIPLRSGLVWSGPVRYDTDDDHYWRAASEWGEPDYGKVALRSAALTALALAMFILAPVLPIRSKPALLTTAPPDCG